MNVTTTARANIFGRHRLKSGLAGQRRLNARKINDRTIEMVCYGRSQHLEAPLPSAGKRVVIDADEFTGHAHNGKESASRLVPEIQNAALWRRQTFPPHPLVAIPPAKKTSAKIVIKSQRMKFVLKHDADLQSLIHHIRHVYRHNNLEFVDI